MRSRARARGRSAAAVPRRSGASSNRKGRNFPSSSRTPGWKARNEQSPETRISGGYVTYVKKTHRLGLLTPSSNTTQEPEFMAALPPTVSLHTGRVAYRNIDPQEQMRCVLELESESRKLADAGGDGNVFAATAATLAKGKGYDRELIKRMEDASGRPATTAATAFVDALNRLGVTKIALGAPWSKIMDRPMVEFMDASGFEIVHSETVGIVSG